MSVHRLLHHTLVYTVASVIYRAASFVLVPLYVRSLPAAEYGRLELITTTAMILGALLSSGVAHSTMRFYFEYDGMADRKAVVSTALMAAGALLAAGAGLAVLFSAQLSLTVLGTSAYTTAFRLAAVALVFELAREISLAYVRATERSALFAVMSLVQLFAQVGASIYAVVYLRLGVTGILAANLFATAIVASLLAAFTFRECGTAFRPDLIPPVVRYGYPLVLTGLSGTIVHSMDRYFAGILVSVQAVGIYALAIRVAAVLFVLVNTPFTNSYGPYRFSIMRQAGAPRIYANVLTLYALAGSFIVVLLSAACRDALRLLAAPEYSEAHRLAPILLAGGLLSGITYCFQTGLYVQKRTRTLLYISCGSGLVNLLALVTFGTLFGLFGIACSAGVASLYAACHTYRAAQRLLPVPYDIGRLVRIALTAGIVIAVVMQIHMDSIWQSLALKLSIAAAYPMLLIVTGGISASDLERVRTVCRTAALRLQPRIFTP